jgi:hypothetical protein
MLRSFILAELLAFLGVPGDVGEGLGKAEWVKDGHAEPNYLHFDALLALFWSSSGKSYESLNWCRDSGPISISKMITSFGLDLVSELPPAS